MSTSFTATMDQLGTHWNAAASAGYPEIGLYLLQACEADATLADRATLAAILAAPGNTEATFTGYVSKILPTPTRNVDATANQVLLGAAAVGTGVEVKWTAAGGTTNNTLVKLLYCYVPTAGAATSLILPLCATNLSASTDGNDLVIILHTDGSVRVKNA
jgi:hypothetical protein